MFLVFVLNWQVHAEKSRDKMLKYFLEKKVVHMRF